VVGNCTSWSGGSCSTVGVAVRLPPITIRGHTMTETISDRLKHTMMRALWVTAALLVLGWVAIGYLVHPRGWTQGWMANQSLAPHDNLVLAVASFGLFLVGVTSLFVMARFRCPRCSKVFGYFFGMRASGFMRSKGPPPGNCPQCGVSLDEQWP
jgi:hypothetical protein